MSDGRRGLVSPRWTALTAELQNSKSPIRVFVSALTKSCSGVSRRHREGAGPLRVPGCGGHPASIGGAFDFALRLLLDPVPNLALAAYGARPDACGPAVASGFRHLVEDFGAQINLDHTAAVTEPRVVPTRDRETLLRAAWALALLTEVCCIGMVTPALMACDTRVDLLSLATPEVVDELGALVDLAEDRLLPHLVTRPAPWYIGPTFTGSRLVSADADLIVGGLLLEIKTVLGTKRADGSRHAYLEPATLRQLIGYVLLDFDDFYQITQIGVYDARYGHLSTWPLADLLTEIAGRPIDIAATRKEFHRLLDPAL